MQEVVVNNKTQDSRLGKQASKHLYKIFDLIKVNMNYMSNLFLGLASVFILTACVTPPKPPECKGEFIPVNHFEQKSSSTVKSGKLISCNGGAVHG